MKPILLFIMLAVCGLGQTKDLDYYEGNDFAVLKPSGTGAIDANGNFGDKFTVILDRPTLIYDPSQNSFEQRAVLKFRIPDTASELQHRLLHKAVLTLCFAGKQAVKTPELVVYGKTGDTSATVTPDDFQPGSKLGILLPANTQLQPNQKLKIDVSELMLKAKPGEFITLMLMIPNAPNRVDLPFNETASIEITLAQQAHLMRDAKPRERVVSTMDNAADWNLEIKNCPKNGKAELSTTTEYTFYGKPALKVDCSGLDANTEVILTPRRTLPMGKNFEMLELWTWGTKFSYGIQRQIKVTIADASGKEYSRDLSMKLACRGPFPHFCDFRSGWKKFDPTQEYFLKSISIRNFAGTDKKDFFGLGYLAVYPNTRPKTATEEFTVKLPVTPDSMVPPVPADKSFATYNKDGSYAFAAESATGKVIYTYKPVTGTLSDFTIFCGGETFVPMKDGGLLRCPVGQREKTITGKLKSKKFDPVHGILTVVWSDDLDASAASTWKIQLIKRSLVIDLESTDRAASGVSLGYLSGMKSPELIKFPYFCFNGMKNGRFGPAVVHSNGVFFYGGLDFFYSNANDFYTDSRIVDGRVLYNGGSNYMPKSDLSREPLRDRIILTASGKVDEVFPDTPTPVLHQKEKAKNYFYFGLNCANNELLDKASDMGLEKLFLWLFWWNSPGDNAVDRLVRAAHGDNNPFSYQCGRDGKPAPELFRDIQPMKFVKDVRDKGYLFGLYTFYLDTNPLQFNFDPMSMSRDYNYQPGMGCLGFYRLRPCCIPSYQKQMSENIRKYWGKLDGVYSDVATIRAYWGGTVDAEPGYPLSGRSHMAPIAELCKRELDDNGGYCISEGHLQWLYAGMTSGSYGTIMNDNPKGASGLPMLPEFNARRIAPKSILVGMSPGAHSFLRQGDNPMPHGKFHTNAVRQYYAALWGFGNAGMSIAWDISYMTMPGIAKIWYLFTPLHPHYLLEEIDRIEYFDGKKYIDTSKAITTKAYLDGKLHKVYKNGTEIYVNYHNSNEWKINVGGKDIVLPPWGFYAFSHKNGVLSCSVKHGTDRIEYSISPGQVYLDAGEAKASIPGLTLTGAGAVRKIDDRTLKFFPLGYVPKGKNAPDLGVREAVIDVRHFLPDTRFSRISVRGVMPDGKILKADADINGGLVMLRPSNGFRNYLIQLEK